RDAAPVVILSAEFWRERYGGDPSIVGRTISIDGTDLRIIGVMPAFEPPKFGWLDEQRMWFPFEATPANRSWGRFLLVVARLRSNVTLAGARAELLSIADRRAREIAADRGWSITIVPLADQITGGVRPSLLV